MLIERAELAGGARRDVRLRGARVAAIAPRIERQRGEAVIDAAGGALLPGLHDHHLHLFALAAADTSVRCGPPEVRSGAALARALAEAPGDGRAWIRGVGYHDSVAGPLQRDALDALSSERPVRIQHRSGALWMLNSRAIERLGLDAPDAHASLERDGAGRVTGRIFGQDAWLREQLGGPATPCLAGVGRRLARFGVTGVTDASVTNGPSELRALEAAAARGELPQRLVVMGSLELPPRIASPEVDTARGALKILLREASLPPFDALEASVREAHAAARNVAVHCVTRAELLLACAVFEAAGCVAGDRIEHASLAHPDVLERVAALPLSIVTQPNFIFERGDAYLDDVDAVDRRWLYRGRGILDAGIPLGGGTDAPFGDPDPWRAMAAAVDRSTRDGAVLSPGESLTPERALALFSTPPDRPGGPARRIAEGAHADLVLLDRPWRAARSALSSACVMATLRAGRTIWQRDDLRSSQ